MLGYLFGFNARIGRLTFFFYSFILGLVVVSTTLAVTGTTHSNIQNGMLASLTSLDQMKWQIIAVTLLFWIVTFMLNSMRFRDIGWDPVCVIPGWIAVMIIDYLIATKFPAMSLGPEHHGTAVGGLVNLALTLALLFWPSGHYEEPAPDSGRSFRDPENSFQGRETASAATSRIARVANGEFGRR